MPWQEESTMEVRRQFMQDVRSGASPVTELCLVYGISRKPGYKWLARYEAGGLPALHDRSRRPQTSAYGRRLSWLALSSPLAADTRAGARASASACSGEGDNGGTIGGQSDAGGRMMRRLSPCGGSARGESRTRTRLPSVDFESTASAIPPLGPGG